MDCINAKYISQKISKTRWRPVSSASLQQPDVFATGSWDNEARALLQMSYITSHTDVLLLIVIHCVFLE